MDVTCERCGTEYEFDETLLSGRGTSVKCTNCGQVFKVYPKPQADADRTTNTWRLRLEDGAVDEIDSLRELQRRISSGELTPENEISRGADGWKALGSIPELATFFQAAGIQIPSARIPSPLPPLPPAQPEARGARESSLPPGRRPRQPTLLGVTPVQRVLPDGPVSARAQVSAPQSRPGSASASGPARDVRASVPEEAPYESPYASDPGPEAATHGDTPSRPAASDIEDAIFEDAIFDEAAPAAIRSSRGPSTAPPAYHDDDDDIPSLPGRSGSPLLWLVLIVAIGALALIAAQWPRIAMLLGVGSDPARIAAGVSEGDAALAEGHPQAYASAIEAYGHALAAGGDRDPEILARLSQASALAAQAQLDAGGTAESIASLTAGALAAAESASKLDPDDVEVKLGLADALRLTGENAEARLVLEEVRAMPFSRTAEFFRVDARLSAAEADGRLQDGLRSARQAVELAPHGVPYLLLLARAERASGDESAARIPLETILADHPNHPVANALLAEMRAAAAVEDPVVAVDAGTVQDAAAAETETEKDPAAQAEGPATSNTAASEPAAAHVDTKPKPATAPRTPPASKAAVQKASVPPPEPAARSRKPVRDEYDRLAEAAGDDAFVDGRPPVRDYEWYMREGQAELAAGNYSRARAFFDSALEARPGSADAMDGLGKVSVRIEDFDLAIRYFRVAAQRGQPDGYFNLAKVYERIGRNEEAVSAYYTYLKRHPTGTYAAAARLAIKALEPRAKLPPELDPDPETGTGPSSEPSRAEEPTQDPEPPTP